MKRIFIYLFALMGLAAILAGCGETVQGVTKDLNRQGNSLRTFFFRGG